MSFETLKPYFPWITLAALVLIVGAINPAFFNIGSLVTLVADIVPLFIMALGMTFAIYIGGIDLSMQQVANLVTVVATVYLAQYGIFVAVICMLCGFCIGAVSSGLNVNRIKILAFALSGLFATIAGLMFSVKLSGGDANLANGFLILAIVAVLVGGTPLTGGVGGVMNTLVGTLIVVVIRSAMVYLQVDATMQQMVFGVILIAAIALTIDRTKMGTVK